MLLTYNRIPSGPSGFSPPSRILQFIHLFRLFLSNVVKICPQRALPFMCAYCFLLQCQPSFFFWPCAWFHFFPQVHQKGPSQYLVHHVARCRNLDFLFYLLLVPSTHHPHLEMSPWASIVTSICKTFKSNFPL